jgi:hypothetical protein
VNSFLAKAKEKPLAVSFSEDVLCQFIRSVYIYCAPQNVKEKMYSIQKPNDEQIQSLASQAKKAPLSTPKKPLEEEPQHHWHQDEYRREISVSDHEPARVHLCVEQMLRGCLFFPGWMIARRIDDLVIVGAQLFGVWGTFADRIIEEHYDGDSERFDMGFTYATIKGHFETGVESFRAVRESKTSPLVFEIKAISRADNPLKKLLSERWVRSLQKKFGHDTPLQFESVLRHKLSQR